MKSYLYLLPLLVFLACGQKEIDQSQARGITSKTYTENQLENLSISLDTVRVDVGEELVIAGAYYGFGLNEDGQSIYFAEGQSTEVHQIDLQKMQLIRRIKFEKDGPNQAPDFINDFQVLPGEEFLLSNYAIQAVFNSEAEKLQNFKIRPEEYAGIDENLESLYTSLLVSPDKKQAFSLPSPFAGFTEGLAVLDLEGKKGKVLKLPALELTKNFRVTFSQNGGSSTAGDAIRMRNLNDKLVIYSGSTADIYLYDYRSDSLLAVKFDHQLVANQKSGSFKTEVSSNEERVEVASQMRKQITFHSLLWDESRKQYFRFGAKENGTNEAGERLAADIFLFSYDPDFNLLGEAKLEQLPNMFFNSFFYQGKLYNYRPIGEEPGFVVITLNY